MKLCSKCKEKYPATLEYFYANKSNRSGLQYWCKECVVEYNKENAEHISEHRREYYRENKEYINRRNRKWYEKNRRAWKEIIRRKFGALRCRRCGYDVCFDVIDAHHVCKDEKEKDIATLVYSKPTEERIVELDKCILLCKNCHYELHAGVWKTEDLG